MRRTGFCLYCLNGGSNIRNSYALAMNALAERELDERCSVRRSYRLINLLRGRISEGDLLARLRAYANSFGAERKHARRRCVK